MSALLPGDTLGGLANLSVLLGPEKPARGVAALVLADLFGQPVDDELLEIGHGALLKRERPQQQEPPRPGMSISAWRA